MDDEPVAAQTETMAVLCYLFWLYITQGLHLNLSRSVAESSQTIDDD